MREVVQGDVLGDGDAGGALAAAHREEIVGALNQIACQGKGDQQHHAHPHQGENPAVFPGFQLIPLFVGLALGAALLFGEVGLVHRVLRPGRLAAPLGQVDVAGGQVPLVDIQLKVPSGAVRVCPPLERGQGDLCLVPGLAFDREGYRLGYGKGYYDCFLAAQPVRTVGLCFEALAFARLPRDGFDRPVCRLVTEAGDARPGKEGFL